MHQLLLSQLLQLLANRFTLWIAKIKKKRFEIFLNVKSFFISNTISIHNVDPALVLLCQGGFAVTLCSRHGRCLRCTLTAAIGFWPRVTRPHLGVYPARPFLASWHCS